MDGTTAKESCCYCRNEIDSNPTHSPTIRNDVTMNPSFSPTVSPTMQTTPSPTLTNQPSSRPTTSVNITMRPSFSPSSIPTSQTTSTIQSPSVGERIDVNSNASPQLIALIGFTSTLYLLCTIGISMILF